MGVHLKLNASHRAAIEDQIESLIALLDTIDGDFDLEPEEDRCCAGDDGCAPFYRDGRRHWGSSDEDRGRVQPIYAVDQTRGPINIEGANRAALVADRGLVPNGRGGWRHP